MNLNINTNMGEKDDNEELQNEKREECIELLRLAGFRKVSLENLDYFDKIIGGVVWCLMRCNLTIDLDILYRENCSMGQRITLCEVLCKSLIGLNCPFRIEAYQLKGLDYINIFPVLQWLIKKSAEMETMDKSEHIGEWYANLVEYYNDVGSPELHKEKDDFLLLINQEIEKGNDRTMKRTDYNKRLDIYSDARCTFAEYVQDIRTYGAISSDNDNDDCDHETNNMSDTGTNDIDIRNFAGVSSRTHVATSSVKTLIDNATIDELYKDEHELDKDGRMKYEEVIENVNKELTRLSKMIEFDAIQYAQSKLEYEMLCKHWEQVHDLIKGYKNDNSEKMQQLVQHYRNVRIKSKEVCAAAKRDLEQLQIKVNTARNNMNDDGDVKKYDILVRDEALELQEVQKERAQVARNLVMMQRKIDKSLSSAMKSQFHKRALEQSDNMLTLNVQLKSLVIQHNTAVDFLKYTTKIVNNVNKLETETMPKTKKSEEYGNAFVEYMKDVRMLLSDIHSKAKLTHLKLTDMKNLVADKRTNLRDKLRDMQTRAEYLDKILKTSKYLHQYEGLMKKVESFQDA